MAGLKSLVERHYAFGNAGDLGSDRALFGEDVVTVVPGMEPMAGIDAFHAFTQAFLTAFPDMNIRMTSSIESGDAIAVEGILSGTHRGPMQTPAGELPPTGKRIELPFTDIFEIQDGWVKSHRVYYDQLTFLRQLGVMP